jgi:hypothetical protein
VDQGTDRVDPGATESEALEREVRALRHELDATLAELDQRRHELTNWRLQLKRHWRAMAVVSVLAGGVIAVLVHRRRAKEQPLGKIRRFRRAVARVIDNPDALAQPSPGVGKQVLVAAARPAAAGIVGRFFRG